MDEIVPLGQAAQQKAVDPSDVVASRNRVTSTTASFSSSSSWSIVRVCRGCFSAAATTPVVVVVVSATSNKYWTVRTCPWRAAQCRAVRPPKARLPRRCGTVTLHPHVSTATGGPVQQQWSVTVRHSGTVKALTCNPCYEPCLTHVHGSFGCTCTSASNDDDDDNRWLDTPAARRQFPYCK
jgi:hypothetical protein